MTVLYGTSDDNRFSLAGVGDQVIGYGGNDEYRISIDTRTGAHTTVTEAINQGSDRIYIERIFLTYSSFSYTLPDNVEDLRILTTDVYAVSNIYGNILNNGIDGGPGNDFINGKDGNDSISGNSGDDNLHGGYGNDTLLGNSGNDILSGDEGDDIIYGDSGDDSIYGGIGNDKIIGQFGNDKLFGNAGSDVFRFDSYRDPLTTYGYSNIGQDRIIDFTSSDKIWIADRFASFTQLLNNTQQVGAHTVIYFGNGNNVTLENYSRANLTANQVILTFTGTASASFGDAESEFGAADAGYSFDFKSLLSDESPVSDDEFAFDIDALIDSFAPPADDATKADDLSLVVSIDEAAVFASGGADATASFDFVSVSASQSIDHAALFAIA